MLSTAATSLIAQGYGIQIGAFKKAFSEKSIEPIQSYLSEELKFDPIPTANTNAVLTNIVSNLPKLNSLTIIETSTERKIKVKYDFVQLGVRESFIHFDAAGKFLRIELIENLIQMQINAQQKLKQSVKQPPTTELAKKYTPKLVKFESGDGLIVSGNLYEIGTDKPIILLAHQAGYNRKEYLDIAPKLNELGFNCLAVDLRSGGDFAEKKNETAQRATEKGLKPSMLDAQQDIEAAIEFLYDQYGTKVILWGSSYSASLSLLEGAKNRKVAAIISFSPGDYFGGEAPSLSIDFKNTKKPFFVTSSKEEAPALTTLIGNIPLRKNQLQFIPESDGFHGSKALWTGQKGAEEYWEALLDFLKAVTNG